MPLGRKHCRLENFNKQRGLIALYAGHCLPFIDLPSLACANRPGLLWPWQFRNGLNPQKRIFLGMDSSDEYEFLSMAA